MFQKKETVIIEDSFGVFKHEIMQIDVIALKEKKFGMDQSHAQFIVDQLIDIIDYLETKK